MADDSELKVFYLLVCRECAGWDDVIPMPFGSAKERGQWAAEHTRGTGHDNWWVYDEPRTVSRG